MNNKMVKFSRVQSLHLGHVEWYKMPSSEGMDEMSRNGMAQDSGR